MKRMDIPFVGAAYKTDFPGWNGQECVNLFPELGGDGSKTVARLTSVPGMKEWLTLNATGGEVRGLKEASNGMLYAVCGASLYSVTTAGVVTEIGGLEATSGPVDLIDNGLELAVIDAPNGYVLNYETGVFGKITDPDFPGAAKAAYMDGYVVFIEPGSSKFWITGLYAASEVDGLDVASAEVSPDNLVSVLVDHRELWLFGQRTTEVWFNSGADDFPFERVSGGVLETGCQARHSVGKLDNSVFWLTDHGTVVRASGYSPMRVSTHAIEYQISTYSQAEREAAQALTYYQGGHAFYALTFPRATWVYDAATGLWHERESWGLNRWRANCHAQFAGMEIVGDVQDGKLYSLDLDTFTEAGNILKATRVTPVVSAKGERLFMSQLYVDMQTGVGLASGQGSDPKAMLEWSDDGGNTWSMVRTASMGRMGQFQARARWWGLGSFRSRMFRLSITDPVRRNILAAHADVEKGSR